ncbi:MAG TPA: hypothetical protein VKJ65_06600, partial [Phycisphaerae bacterium]|nr:hypothetical protein [Phycisphaerae bacterium]
MFNASLAHPAPKAVIIAAAHNATLDDPCSTRNPPAVVPALMPASKHVPPQVKLSATIEGGAIREVNTDCTASTGAIGKQPITHNMPK